jgi:hypothetical protein
MSSHSEIIEARDEVLRTRAHISDTIAEVKGRGTSAVSSVKRKLDVVEGVRSNPWWALAAAIGAGVLVGRSDADAQTAALAKRKARELASVGAQTARDGVRQGLHSARQGPTLARSAAVGALDSLAARLALSLIERLREPRPPARRLTSPVAVETAGQEGVDRHHGAAPDRGFAPVREIGEITSTTPAHEGNGPRS